MKRYLMLFFLTLNTLVVNGQPSSVSGRVSDKHSREPIVGVSVVYGSTNRYTITDSRGGFTIVIPQRTVEGTLVFSMLGYERLEITVKHTDDSLNIELTPKPFEIAGVVVRAPKIRQYGDTIAYNVASFADVQDRAIGDVLRKMPGIEVAQSGEIRYNGQSINKFYIDGEDLLEGKYGIATNNISYKNIASIEVMENHQPIRALFDLSSSNQAAINLKLKESAQTKWTGNAKIGAGVPLLWNAEAMAMSIGGKWQSISTLKSNNNGMDIIGETKSMTIDELINSLENSYELPDYLNVSPPTAHNLDDKLFRFNQTNVLNTSNLWKLGKDFQLKALLTFANDKLNRESQTHTEYLLNDSTIIIDEIFESLSNLNSGVANVTLVANTDKFYLKNMLKIDMNWSNIHLSTAGSYPNRQTATVANHKISNDLQLIQRFGKRTLTFTSKNQYLSKPQELLVNREISDEFQSISTSAFYSNTNAAFGIGFSNWYVSANAGFTFLERVLDEAKFSYAKFYVTPRVEYKSQRFNLTLESPLSYYRYTYNLSYNNSIIMQPKLSVRWHISPKLTLSASGRIGANPISGDNLYDGLVMRNYRSFSRGIVDFTTSYDKSLTLGLAYKNPVDMFFANISATRSWRELPLMAAQNFEDQYIISSYIPHSNSRKMWFATGNISKGVEALSGVISVNASYSSFDMVALQNDITMPYLSSSLNISPKINSRVTGWFNFEYQISYSISELKLNNSKSETHSFVQTAKAVMSPTKKFSMQILASHYYNQLTENKVKHMFLSDLILSYRINEKLEILGSVTNIFDQRDYSYSIYNGLSVNSSSYKLRPRNYMLSLYCRF